MFFIQKSIQSNFKMAAWRRFSKLEVLERKKTYNPPSVDLSPAVTHSFACEWCNTAEYWIRLNAAQRYFLTVKRMMFDIWWCRSSDSFRGTVPEGGISSRGGYSHTVCIFHVNVTVLTLTCLEQQDFLEIITSWAPVVLPGKSTARGLTPLQYWGRPWTYG